MKPTLSRDRQVVILIGILAVIVLVGMNVTGKHHGMTTTPSGLPQIDGLTAILVALMMIGAFELWWWFCSFLPRRTGDEQWPPLP